MLTVKVSAGNGLRVWTTSGHRAMFIDCHCHLTSEQFQDDLEATIVGTCRIFCSDA